MEPITRSITEAELGSGERIFLAPTGAKSIVTLEGSLLGGWGSLPRAKAETQALMVELLDAGTKTKNKEVIRGALASRGAQLSFRDGVDRTFFSGSCFPEDLSFLLATLAECLSEPAFPARELAAAKKVMLGELEESRTDTRSEAAGALSRLLFSKGHVNHTESTASRMRNVASVTRADLVAFHKTLGKKGLVVALTGDIEPTKALTAVKKAFKNLPEGSAERVENRSDDAHPASASESFVPIADKANIDIFFGAKMPFTYENPRYLPLVVLSSMLGGRGLSTGHLMRTIRERDGYTYGIYAQQNGFTDAAHGAFRIWATFSPANYKEAIAATRKEIGLFLKSGITDEALEVKKTEMCGNYLIGLSTSKGLASALHSLGIQGKPLSYIDEYPSLIRAVTVPDLKEVAPGLDPSKLSLAAAGTFAKK